MSWIIFFVVLGAITGSFLNVYILRLHTGKSVSGRSSCATCAYPLKAAHLIPVFSFFLLRARCANCKVKISWQYPLVEISLSAMFGLVYFLMGYGIDLLFILLLLCISAVIFVYDIRHMIIPQNTINWLWAIVATWFLWRLSTGLDIATMAPSIALSAIVFTGPLFLTWYFSKGRAMGFGDVKLALPLSLLLTPWYAYYAITLAFVLGAVWSLSVMFSERVVFRKQNLNLKSEVPFAPFIICAFWAVFLFGGYFV